MAFGEVIPVTIMNDRHIGSRQPKFFYGYGIVLAAFLIMVIMWGANYTFGVFLKPILNEFSWTTAMVSGAYSVFMILHGLLYVLTGKLNDKFGPRITMTVGGVFLGLGYLLMSQISAIWQLYLFYGVIIGIAMSTSYVPLVSTVSRWFVKRRGMMTGIVVAGVGAGTMIMPPITSRIISAYGWHTSYIIVGSVALVLVILAAQFLKRDPSKVGELPYGANEVSIANSDGSEAREFSLREAVSTRQFWMFWAATMCFGFCLQTVMVHVVSHAIELGSPAISAANILVVIGGISIAGRIIVGITADRVGNKPAYMVSFVLFAAALFWLFAAKEIWMLYLFAVIFGFAYGGQVAVQSPLVAELFGTNSHGVILGSITVGTTLGGAAGPFLAGRIFDVSNSYNLAFLICGVLATIGFILVSLLRPTRTDISRQKISMASPKL